VSTPVNAPPTDDVAFAGWNNCSLTAHQWKSCCSKSVGGSLNTCRLSGAGTWSPLRSRCNLSSWFMASAYATASCFAKTEQIGPSPTLRRRERHGPRDTPSEIVLDWDLDQITPTLPQINSSQLNSLVSESCVPLLPGTGAMGLSGDVLMLSGERECACGAGAWVRAVAGRHPCIFRGYKSSLIARKFSTLLT
jgi:hypothetical protein